MQALVKGSHAPRVVVTCGKCGKQFERSAVHPYIVDCPECRGKAAGATRAEKVFKRRVKCPVCRELLSHDGGLGMKVCGKCGRQWWSMPGGTWRDWITDEVFEAGKYVGNIREDGYFRVYHA